MHFHTTVKTLATSLILAAGLIATSAQAHSAAAPAASGNIRSAIETSARNNNLDPALLQAVIQAESGFNPRAKSPSGAVGLMQLLPSTARHVGINNVWSPAHNVEAGARYLRQMINQFGSTSLALAAYNAGPGNVRKFGYRIPPFKETQRYVPKVMGYYNRFKSI